MNLSNSLTVLRIFLVPVLVAVLLTRRGTEGLLAGTAIFGLGVLLKGSSGIGKSE